MPRRLDGREDGILGGFWFLLVGPALSQVTPLVFFFPDLGPVHFKFCVMFGEQTGGSVMSSGLQVTLLHKLFSVLYRFFIQKTNTSSRRWS